MRVTAKFALLLLASVAALAVGIGIGSVSIPAGDMAAILGQKLLGIVPDVPVSDSMTAIFWQIRLPRTLLAFLVGGALAVSGVLMQSVLRNPLASSYTLGVSSGAAVGAAIAMLTGASFLGMFTLPFFGLSFGLLTVFFAVGTASRLDRNLGTTTIILTGMAVSMFANAIISFAMAWLKESLQRLIFWQMGSFSLKDWSHPALLLPVVVVAVIIALGYSREMDIMTFGEEQAQSAGVETRRVKWILLSTASVMAGCAVALVGIIGFVDLFTPHVARRFVGAQHRLVIPASALLGGIFMVLCDLAARTMAAPLELPVGAVTSLFGAPFFLYLYYGRRKVRS